MLDAAKGNISAVVDKLMRSSDTTLQSYVMQIGVESIASKRRAFDRRELRHEVINPDFVNKVRRKRPPMSRKEADKLATATLNVFQKWRIGEIALGDATKQKLLAEANAERHAGNGHMLNAEFYEILAEPMNDSETVAQHWKSAKTVDLIREDLWKDAQPIGEAAE